MGIVRSVIQFSVHFMRTCVALMEVLLSTWRFRGSWKKLLALPLALFLLPFFSLDLSACS